MLKDMNFFNFWQFLWKGFEFILNFLELILNFYEFHLLISVKKDELNLIYFYDFFIIKCKMMRLQ